MALGLIQDTTLKGIADAIREKTGDDKQYIPSEMSDAILNIEGGTTNYDNLSNKPSINNIELTGNKTTDELGIVIPTKLPSPSALTFTGLVEKTYDGSESVVVNIPAKEEFSFIESINLLDNSSVINGYYNQNGVFSESPAYRATDYIDISLNKGNVNAYICEDVYGGAVSSWYTINFYNAEQDWISGIKNDQYSDIATSLAEVPDETIYVKVSFVNTSKGSKYMVTTKKEQYGYEEYKRKTVPYSSDVNRLRPDKWVGKKVLVIGDSISTSNYRGLTPEGENLPLWPKWDDILEDRLGFLMTKDAISSSGFFVQPNIPSPGPKAICYRVDDYPADGNYDMIIIFAGINDYLQGVRIGTEPTNDRTKDFISSIQYSINTLVEKYPSARIVGLIPLPVGMFSQEEQNDTSNYTNAIKTIYNKFQIPYLDLSQNSGFRPLIQSFKNKFTLLGGSASNPVADGVHPNQEWDNNYLTPMIEEFINKFI